MTKKAIALMIGLGILLAANSSLADSSQLTAFYEDYLTEKIANCERIASIDKPGSSCMIDLVRMKALQSKFYKQYRQELVRKMVASNLGTKPHKSEYFLVTEFNGTFKDITENR